jgi:hypothetical protein
MHAFKASFFVLLLAALGCSAGDPSSDTAVDELQARCGKVGQACCADNRCRRGLNCNFNTQLCTASCGAAGDACCGVAQACDSGLFCNFDHCASSCGEAGQECCRPENRCFNGSTCNLSSGFCE